MLNTRPPLPHHIGRRKLVPLVEAKDSGSLPRPSIAIAYVKSTFQVGYWNGSPRWRRVIPGADVSRTSDESAPVLPDSFLGGSAPRPRTVWFNSIPFPGLVKLLLNAMYLVQLHLNTIPNFGEYFSQLDSCLSSHDKPLRSVRTYVLFP